MSKLTFEPPEHLEMDSRIAQSVREGARGGSNWHIALDRALMARQSETATILREFFGPVIRH